jgi:hypothetical protein
MKIYILTIASVFLSFNTLTAQDSLRIKKKEQYRKETSNKGQLYIYWGYNRAYFSKSNIHFTGPDYDITFYNLKAYDRPTKFSFSTYFNPQTLSIPQYNFHIGYFVTDRFHISIGTDHMKYVVDGNQKAVVSGVVSESVSPQYAGTYFHDTIQLNPDILQFEHTNGLNLMTIDVNYLQPVANIYRKKIWLKWNVGIGGIWVVTKTDLKIFGDGIDNDFHIAGYSLSGKTGPRVEFWNWCFFSFEVKAGYMTLPVVLIHNEQPKLADHNFSFIEYYGMLGLQIPLNMWLKKKK